MIDSNTATANAVDMFRDARCVSVVTGDSEFSGFIGGFVREEDERAAVNVELLIESGAIIPCPPVGWCERLLYWFRDLGEA